MTTTVTPPARTVRPPRKAQSNGQWALDGRKPLNDNEAFKQDGSPLAVRDRIVNIYGPGGYETIAPDDLNGRFRWWGPYTQRKQGIDGGRTARL
ncbi:MAG: nitrite/sulfite reductase, partial [Actinomyces sp.]